LSELKWPYNPYIRGNLIFLIAQHVKNLSFFRSGTELVHPGIFQNPESRIDHTTYQAFERRDMVWPFAIE
jgi:hypothetical protein